MAYDFGGTCAPIVWRGISFYELVSSAEFDYGENPKTTRKYGCQWDVAEALAAALLGGIQPGGGGTQLRILPHADPNRNYLLAQAVRGSGYGQVARGGFGEIIYEVAILEVEYLLPPQDGQKDKPGEITFITERHEASMEQQLVENGEILWASGPNKGKGLDENTKVYRLTPTITLSFDIHWWFYAPLGLILEQKLGEVNKSSFRILDIVYPKGTLRFDHTSKTRQLTSVGLETW